MIFGSHPILSHYRVAAASAFARQRHQGQLRDSGELFYTHPHSVALLLVHAGVRNPETLAAAYLHDVGDKRVARYEELENLFGRTIAGIVNELTDAPSSIEVKHNSQVERIKRLSHGALLINVADNVHNRATIRFKVDPERRQRIVDKIGRIADSVRSSTDDPAVRLLLRVHDRQALGVDDDLGHMRPSNVHKFVARARTDMRIEAWREFRQRTAALFNIASYPRLRALYAGNRPPEL